MIDVGIKVGDIFTWQNYPYKRGSLSQDYINKFVKHLKIDRHIQKIAKKDIYNYLRSAGFKVA